MYTNRNLYSKENRRVSDNQPVQKDLEVVTEGILVPDGEVVPYRTGRQLPSYAYVRTGLGELSLLARLDDTIRLLTDVLRPLVANFETQSPQPLLCVICNRNFAGWPLRVLEDHWFQHSLIQRKMAAMGIR
jgi:hypothetical protein